MDTPISYLSSFVCPHQSTVVPFANFTLIVYLTPPSTLRFTLLPMGILQITGTKRSDAGVYRCVATNIANTRYSHEAQLNVTGQWLPL